MVYLRHRAALARMSTGLRQQLTRLETRLGAWMARDEDFADHADAESESRARTFLCFLENVFGRFYEFKARLCDYDDIPESYGVDWESFKTDACNAARDARPFNGICAVMHLQMAPDGKGYAIHSVGLRPCAIEQSFVRVMLKHLARSLPNDRPLAVKVPGARAEFVHAALAGLKGAHESGVLTPESMAALRTLEVPWDSSLDPGFPAAERLNDSSKANPGRAELIRRMGHEGVEWLRGRSGQTNYLPDALALDENELWVYKESTKFSFLPDERRFFMRGPHQRFFEICWGVNNEKYVENVDSQQGGKSVRFEFVGGTFVFFLLPKDFARRTVAHKQRIKLDGKESVLRLMAAIVMDGEKIVGMDGDSLVLSRKQDEEAVVVWHEKPEVKREAEVGKVRGFVLPGDKLPGEKGGGK
jgi:hypothetical protein